MESAWHYRRQPRMSKAIRGRTDEVSAGVRELVGFVWALAREEVLLAG